jgi:hypothetical protein
MQGEAFGAFRAEPEHAPRSAGRDVKSKITGAFASADSAFSTLMPTSDGGTTGLVLFPLLTTSVSVTVPETRVSAGGTAR